MPSCAIFFGKQKKNIKTSFSFFRFSTPTFFGGSFLVLQAIAYAETKIALCCTSEGPSPFCLEKVMSFGLRNSKCLCVVF